MTSAITQNPVARIFFVYLLLLLAAILGQDVLLEPFGAEAFGLTVTQTTRITSIWGTFVLVAILIAGVLEGRVAKKTVAQFGNLGALAGFVVIIVSGLGPFHKRLLHRRHPAWAWHGLIHRCKSFPDVRSHRAGHGRFVYRCVGILQRALAPGGDSPRRHPAGCGEPDYGAGVERVSCGFLHRSLDACHCFVYVVSY